MTSLSWFDTGLLGLVAFLFLVQMAKKGSATDAASWFKANRYAMLLLFVAALLGSLLWLDIPKAPTLSRFAKFVSTYWIYVPIVGILAFFAAGLWGGTYRTLLQQLVTWVGVGILAIPVMFAIRDVFLPSRICPNISANEIRECRVNTAWSYEFQPEDGTPNGYYACVVGAVEKDARVVNGRSLYRLRAIEGDVVARYKAQPNKCGGPLL